MRTTIRKPEAYVFNDYSATAGRGLRFGQQKHIAIDMKKYIPSTLLLACLLLISGSIYAQSLSGIFEKEEPQFFARLTPTQVPGEVQLVFHFTHSKIRELELSVWIQDLGANLQDSEEKMLMRGLHTIGNRHRDTVLLTGLSPRHFYNIGVDYQQPSALVRKFEGKVIREHYRYPGSTAETTPQLAEKSVPAAPAPQAYNQPPQPQQAPPCEDPSLNIQVDPVGYCGALNRPAVIILCNNCQGVPWDFSVEVRTEDGKWQSTRVDGRPQAALGVSPRTEPLCMINPGEYYLRVLAWGENCSMPVISTLGTKIQVGEAAEDRFTQRSGNLPSPYRQQPAAAVRVPEVCGATAIATLTGKTIRGSVMLPPDTECSQFNPYINLTYVHPGYRDINIGDIPLYGGIEKPFELDLDEQDLTRGIHTLKATVFLQHPDLTRPVAAETFWIRADEPAISQNSAQAVIPDLESRIDQRTQPPLAYEPQPESYGQSTTMRGTISKRGIEREEEDLYIDEALLEEDGSTINVTATDPNCNQIQNLQLVYSPTQPDRPLYLSWLSPRCCQESGCQYTVWTGPSPDQLSLLVKGQKAGAQVSELLQGLPADHSYFEVAVQTSNGVRKAAYLPGRGPIYGIEAVLDYHDQFRPQYSDPVQGLSKGNPADVQPKGAAVGGALANRMGDMPASRPAAMYAGPQQPKFPISKFDACKYSRETEIIAEQPIYEGDQVVIEYKFTEPDHRYTLYHQPYGSNEWVVAPGTQDLQPSPRFELQAGNYHSGKYLVLVYKPSKNWGCLSAPVSDPLEINVVR